MSIDPLHPLDPDAAGRENKARWRFFAINLVRLGGAFIIVLGILLMLQKLSWAQSDTAKYAGFALSVSGMFVYVILTRLLVRRWATPRDGK